MFAKKTRVNLTNEEKRLLLHSLVELKNDLIRQAKKLVHSRLETVG